MTETERVRHKRRYSEKRGKIQDRGKLRHDREFEGKTEKGAEMGGKVN